MIIKRLIPKLWNMFLTSAVWLSVIPVILLVMMIRNSSSQAMTTPPLETLADDTPWICPLFHGPLLLRLHLILLLIQYGVSCTCTMFIMSQWFRCTMPR
mmetsp:Transcript_129824/g.289627  ORF Transcript_129824/g.289627 Transcript_129824/m.289627 type:complete len:99 (-) Transcript_129824:473-769(-)